MNTYLKDTDVAWAAGLFEGEGSIFKARHGKYDYVRLSVKMTDLDIIKRIQGIFHCGTIQYQTPNCQRLTPTRKRHYTWQLCNEDEIKYVIGQMWSYLGERRKSKAKELGIVNAGVA